MENKLFEMCFELEDILDAQETGYKNMFDIAVSGEHSFLLDSGIISHNSAVGGLAPVLGRKECGYYELRGKPLNAYSASQSKFTNNKELSELYKIVQNENYEYIIFACDSDLDGMHIIGLLAGFFDRYLPELKGNIGRLLTPVKFIKKGKIPTNWVYSINEELSPKNGEEFSYMKGLGSWDMDDLKYIVSKDGLKKMIDIFEFNDDKIIDDWLGDDSEPRKKYILANDFSIASI
jgi:DNA gyrase/topoisomerase IV subunit B